jgi:hypothetical protein
MIRRYITAGIILSFLMATNACQKEKVFPVEPHIEFVSFTKIQNSYGYDDKGILKLSFTDGDGDIGLSDADTDPPFDTSSIYYHNFFIAYFEKQHGVFKEVELPLSNNSRIPIINPDGGKKSMQGDIEIELFINNYFSSFDTIRFECYIVDRALHHSNTVSTGDIIIKKH